MFSSESWLGLVVLWAIRDPIPSPKPVGSSVVPSETAVPTQVHTWPSHKVICNVVVRPEAGGRASCRSPWRQLSGKYSEIMGGDGRYTLRGDNFLGR